MAVGKKDTKTMSFYFICANLKTKNGVSVRCLPSAIAFLANEGLCSKAGHQGERYLPAEY